MSVLNLGVQGAPGVITHFWAQETESHSLIRQLYRLASNHSQEDIVHHVWNAILRVYFPSIATAPNGQRWTVLLEPYRGPLHNLPIHRPDILVVRLQHRQVTSGINVVGRDFIWVECKPPSHDRPSGWKNVLVEAVGRLQDAHPTRVVPVIVAVGRRMMFFSWDPISTNNAVQLSIRSGHPHTLVWPLDRRLRPWTGPWVNQATGRIDLSRALEIDCLTTEIVNGQTVLTRRADLAQIELILVTIRNMTLQGTNSAYWSC
ncbi:hypothetical protein ACJ72_05626 [Emergomyces africanus]|uniref:Fungal-type protein kinase domain-containing protein n=1 Tax=Emergomyces africanus TaxID=1955775 RepID=A0A1B7NTD9_9EURO|nr:hypothetical protein ACJ72_05626 [Emergomyces africanus]